MSGLIAPQSLLALFVLGSMATLGCNGGGSGDGDDEESEEGAFDEGTGLGEGDCADICGTPACGTCPSATMVDGGGFQIDATEVDNGQYALMLEVEFDVEILPPGCEWKSDFEPEEWADDLDPTLPVVGVDWCDAMVFCAWSGKELCGAVTGGASDWDNAEDAEGDTWYRACSSAGAQGYPYGPDYEAAACNGEDSGQDALLAGGSLSTCEGGAPGLFDMSGNVWEWTNSCESATGDGATECRRRGGSRYSDGDNMRCAANSRRVRGERDNALGFRCCG
ncbi:Formylglycine-generating sulfatase enzyme [Enhygromyxa salina]|uniref:Formylglycine-generating sulfatase enzyme n=1 Tax=Enhygromyxa salina TaxID=215803 RepID=A0A2S9XNM8_9BACT|nr:formylglycine-generating enzyme family protein [Enhygromyxa salina]PRP94463.1 Formylglycine-generating sulfatase enzyme [Enhygromyxa salina]